MLISRYLVVSARIDAHTRPLAILSRARAAGIAYRGAIGMAYSRFSELAWHHKRELMSRRSIGDARSYGRSLETLARAGIIWNIVWRSISALVASSSRDISLAVRRALKWHRHHLIIAANSAKLISERPRVTRCCAAACRRSTAYRRRSSLIAAGISLSPS